MRGIGKRDSAAYEGRLGGLAAACRRIADSSRFQALIIGVIVANALVLGLETYESLDDEIGGVLNTLNGVFLGVFTV